jgi:Flp pilus assembly protein TadG
MIGDTKLAARSKGKRLTFKALIKALARNRSGLALIEFAYSVPVLMIIGANGLELANWVLVRRRLGDLASMAADNASRIGTDSVLANLKVTEADINQVLLGARLQSGNMNIQANGRVIISSLQKNADGGQWIAWQRCTGALNVASAYGPQGTGATGTSFLGMGPSGQRVTASDDTAVMFVEMTYKYQAIVPVATYNFGNVKEESSFNIRDNRELSPTNNPANPSPAATVSTC